MKHWHLRWERKSAQCNLGSSKRSVTGPSQTTAEPTLTSRIVRHILDAVDRGEYRTSERLPSEREMAERLVVSRNTVTAAYAQLEQRGILRRIRGKGAYLCALPKAEESFSWSGKISRFANALDEPVLELLARRCADQIEFPFSAGTPSLDVFSREIYAESIGRVMEATFSSALGVAPTEGQWALRVAIGSWLRLPPQHIMITAGAQEGIDLVARCLIEPGDCVVVDSPTYPGALQSFLSAGARLLPWGTDWSMGQLEELLLRYQPKLIFTMPTFQNPTGRVMSLKTRLSLLDLARRYRVPVVEDDVYSRTYFADHPMPGSLCTLDQHSQVINLSTFSKMLAPGLRIGWIVAPPYMVKQLALIKMRSNLFTCGLNQLVLADMVAGGHLDQHLQRLRRHHCGLRDTAVEALGPSTRKGLLRCRVPSGGLYLWCKVLTRIDMEGFFLALEKSGVSVAPGIAFEPERTGRTSSHFRLCFTAVPRERLERGIRVLNQILERFSQPVFPDDVSSEQRKASRRLTLTTEG